MEGVCGNGDDAFKFTCAPIWWIRTWAKSFLGEHRKCRLAQLAIRILGMYEPNCITNRQNSSFVREIQQIRQASLTAYFSGKLNLASGEWIRESKMGDSFYAKLCFPTDKSETKRRKTMVMARNNYWGFFGRWYDLVHFRGEYLEVDLEDMRPENRLLDVLGRSGALKLHLPCTKFTMRYLVDSQTLISLSKMRHESPNRNQTPYANTDARTSPNAFYEPTHNQKIPTMRWEGLGRLRISRNTYLTWEI